jgi:hypothetical protein
MLETFFRVSIVPIKSRIQQNSARLMYTNAYTNVKKKRAPSPTPAKHRRPRRHLIIFNLGEQQLWRRDSQTLRQGV